MMPTLLRVPIPPAVAEPWLPARPALLQGSVLQCGLILASSIGFWAFRSGESERYGYIMH